MLSGVWLIDTDSEPAMAVDKLPTLAQALVKAEAKARELGLIDNAKADA